MKKTFLFECTRDGVSYEVCKCTLENLEEMLPSPNDIDSFQDVVIEAMGGCQA